MQQISPESLPEARPEHASTSFFGALESLRGLAAVAVVLYHLPFAPAHQFAFVRNGHVAVEFFFVLSGFVLYHTYRTRLHKAADLPRFILLRLARIYPVHILFAAIFTVIEVAKLVGTHHAGWKLQVENSIGAILTAFGENALLIHGMTLRSTAISLNFPSWSISTEFFTYIVFGIGLVLWSRRFVAYAAITCVTAFAGLYLPWIDLGDFQELVRCMAGFFLGCLTYAVYLYLKSKDPGFDLPGLLLITILIGMSLDWGSHEVVWMLGFLAASAFILAVVLTPRRMTTRLLESRPLRWLGRISYSLYMGHALVLYVARHSIHILLGPRSDSPLWGGLYCAATVVAVVVFGWLVFRFVEFPAHNWVRAISARNSLPARPAIL